MSRADCPSNDEPRSQHRGARDIRVGGRRVEVEQRDVTAGEGVCVVPGLNRFLEERATERGDQLAYEPGSIAWCEQDGIHQHNRSDLLGVGGGEFECHESAETVADYDRPVDPQLHAHPCHVISETLHGVALLGRVALAVTPKIHGRQMVTTGEVVHLRGPEAAVAGHSVHKHQRWGALPSLLIAERHAFTHERSHDHSLKDTPAGWDSLPRSDGTGVSIVAGMATREDIRNIAIVAHVDHGKTTLVDALLWESGAFRSGQQVDDRVLDSMDLEREKGITILAKNTAIRYGGVKLNIIDTPGHADFGGEVERGLTMVDGVLLLVDASEGPLPQTRFVLRKALEARLPVILVVNKVDRPDARIDEVVDEVYELFLDLDADESQIEFPIVYSNAKEGWATLDPARPGTDLRPLLELLLETVPPPEHDPNHPFQAHVTNLDSSPYVGRIAICRVRHGRVRRGDTVAWCRADGRIEHVKVSELYVTEALDRVEAEEAAAGEIISVAGIPEITIGETLADADDPRPLPVISVDEPSLSVTIGINTSPLAGQDGYKLTASQLKQRLDRELIGNVSLRVHESERPDVWEVQGRGEMALAVLVELMRREGFELTVGKPQIVTREIENKLCEPIERMTVDVPEEYVGVITQLLAMRKGRLEQMVNHGTGWVRMDYLVPARGLIGFRTEFIAETRGTGVMHHVFERWEPWHGELRTRPTGSLVADRRGTTAAFALFNLQERGTLFVSPGEHVYEGMIVGENSRAEDLDVNASKEKHLTNMRSSTADTLVRLIPKRELSLDQALEYLRSDECIEVTPHAIRLRKATLEATTRRKLARSGQR